MRAPSASRRALCGNLKRGCEYPTTAKSVYRVRRLVATELDGSQRHRSNLTDTSSVTQTVIDYPVLGNNGYDR